MSKGDKRGYSYYTNKDGEHVMRVSDVIKILAKDSITVWANMLGLKGIKYREELNRTAHIGSLCHDVIEHYFNKNTLAVIDYEEFDIGAYGDKKEVRRALDSFFQWFFHFKQNHTYNIKFTEMVVVGKELGGTIDCGIDGWEDPEKVIFVDYKSSGFYLSQFLQLAGYTLIYEELYGPDTVEGVMVVAMDKKGEHPAKARFLPRKDMDPFIICFQCMMDVAKGTKLLDTNLTELTQLIH